MKRFAPAALLVLGLLQMAGDILGLKALRGLGAATNASPAPKVFTTSGGLETFSTQFHLQWARVDGTQTSVRLDSTLYRKFRGPYNRRNVYGAALAYGPVLPADLRDPVLRYALCGDAPLLAELGLVDPHRVGPVQLRYVPAPGTNPPATLPLLIAAPCD